MKRPSRNPKRSPKLEPLDEKRLDEVKGGALNAYLSLSGETQGELEGETGTE